MKRKTTSFKINPEIWKDLKVHCVKRDMDISEYLEFLIKENLAKQDILSKEKKDEIVSRIHKNL